jgi:NitT/TauT family transport system ATP-binding protein
MSGPLIALRNVARRFPAAGGKAGFTAVQGIDLEIEEGRFIAVVGPSGCGKSTILNMIAGLDAPSEGSIVVACERVAGRLRGDVGYLFQKDALLPWKTVQANVELPLVFRGIKGDHGRIAREWLARVGLAGFEGNFPHQLSGGMRKRVALAATFVYGPRILLMDEPFSALDVQTRNMMENELLELWQTNGGEESSKTVIFVTHDLEEAIALADEVVVLTANPGRVKRRFHVGLDRPRNVNDIRFDDRFRLLHAEIWEALREEVARSYALQRTLVHG